MALATHGALQPVHEPISCVSLPDLEVTLHEALSYFDTLSRQRPKARNAVTRARLGRDLEDALSEIGTLRGKIAKLPAVSLADVAVKLRRLAAGARDRDAEALATTALDGLEMLA